jgi:hypothetical protein
MIFYFMSGRWYSAIIEAALDASFRWHDIEKVMIFSKNVLA